MPSDEQNARGKSQGEERADAQEAVHAAQFVSSVGRLTSLLEQNLAGGRSLDDAMNTWSRWQTDSLLRRYSHTLDSRPAWWSYFRNPVWTCVFILKRRQILGELERVGEAKLALLDYYLGRAEFVFALSPESRNFLRRKINDGKISRSRAMSLTRSVGCRILKSGDLLPAPVGLIGLTIGKILVSIFVAVFLLFVFSLATELQEPCARLCVVVGSAQLMVFSIYLTALTLSLSAGRNRDARLLSALQG